MYLQCFVWLTIFGIVTLAYSSTTSSLSNDGGTFCDGEGWVAYRDEKCFKLIKQWASRNQAKARCAQEEHYADGLIPQLASIKSLGEQTYLTENVINTSDVTIDVWIGAKRQNGNKFVWEDGSEVGEFTNWAKGCPTDKAQQSCVMMKSEYMNTAAQWRDVPCDAQNYVLCEKLPRWSTTKMQQTLLKTRKELNDSNEFLLMELDETNDQLESTINELNITKNQITTTNNELSLTKNKLEGTKNELNITKNQLARINSELNLTKNQLEGTKNELTITKNQLVTTNKDLSSTKTTVGSIYNDLVITKHQLASTKNELTNTKKQLESTNYEVSYIKNQLTSTNSELRSTKNQLSSTKNELSGIKIQLTNTKNELTSTNNQLTSTNNQLTTTKNLLDSTITDLTNIKTQLSQSVARLETKNIFVPVGFLYTQLPNEKAPSEMWPSMRWADVSSSYAGVFFRVQGGGSALFGQVQTENTQKLTGIQSDGTNCNLLYNVRTVIGGWSQGGYSGGGDGGNICLKFEMSGGEIRPRNMAIRVWRRTG